ncbi:MAG: hypothetical protein IZT57_03270, partial [Chloroflexi bacterium]|nr:hypothetical protein [Chloroflexota bacterium]
ICPRYGLPHKDTGVSCPHCLSRQFHTKSIGSPFEYEGLLRHAIHQFKYGNLIALDNTLARDI